MECLFGTVVARLVFGFLSALSSDFHTVDHLSPSTKQIRVFGQLLVVPRFSRLAFLIQAGGELADFHYLGAEGGK